MLYIDPKFAGLVNNNIGFGCCAQDSLINTDWHDFAPRIGLAWRPWKNDNKLVIRGGYGIFYDVLMNFYPTQSVGQNIPFVSPTLPNPVGTENPQPLDIRNLFPAPYTIAGRNFPPPYCDAPSQAQFDPTGQCITAILHQCFGEQAQLPVGTAGRNIVRSTGQTAGDFSLFKNTRINERANVQFRAEFFNLFWSPTYFPRFPSNNLQDTNFGPFFSPVQNRGILYGAFPRIIQLALKLTF